MSYIADKIESLMPQNFHFKTKLGRTFHVLLFVPWFGLMLVTWMLCVILGLVLLPLIIAICYIFNKDIP